MKGDAALAVSSASPGVWGPLGTGLGLVHWSGHTLRFPYPVSLYVLVGGGTRM